MPPRNAPPLNAPPLNAPALNASDYDFDLPPDRIAIEPARPRDSARLLHVTDTLTDRHVHDLPDLLRAGDLLIANDTRVIPAQLAAHRGSARIGLTLDRPLPDGTWHALARNARRLHPGDPLTIDHSDTLTATVATITGGGSITLRFNLEAEAFTQALNQAGALALPPYIPRPDGPTATDATDYQTIFAQHQGAVAAPTAGLHFTPELLARLAEKHIARETITLHVGAGTFLPLRHDDPRQHRIHAERGHITPTSAARINAARAAGHRLIAIGTTTLRLLESATDAAGTVHPFTGETRIFLLPGHRFRSADVLLTNFHLPRSTLFALVCAFAGTGRMCAAYAHAIAQNYRFYSYGDATLLERC